ncbi:methionine sulfoxide reductase A [Auricularia subglabra TFB-10046 SS5]|uniref:peptide-methionine (S)-S-oxide reductase n=1 Tax=Auricularia subglabra (strain TFB-10046 / SS5) TaxID=717982 RepID=J0LJD4_AURST|nr:methionine sulfoxide reductase A [Auricularia subglabra TFB-10046 SS5]
MLSRLSRLAFTLPFLRPATTNAQGISSASQSPMSSTSEIATFASGCFWGTEHIFLKHYRGKGVLKTAVGYTGGRPDVKSPSYRQVCTGATGHAEAVRLEFDPAQVSYAELVDFFYRTHDPTTLNSQGPDTGTQYRSAIFTHSKEQEETAQRVTTEVQQKHFDPKGKKIVTTIEPATDWYDAEDYHQEYLFKNPTGYQCPTHRLHW